MGRYIRDIRLEQPIDVVSMVMDDFIYHNRFLRTDWNGEMVFSLKDRHGKDRYMKWYYVDGQFHVEAWLKNSFGGETDLKGGGAARREFRTDIDRLIDTLKKTAAGSLAAGHVGSDPLHHDGRHTDNHDRWKEDTRWQQGSAAQPTVAGHKARPAQTASAGQKAARPAQAASVGQKAGSARTTPSETSAAMIYAILALFLGGILPILGIIFIVLARKKAEYSSNPGAVKILCIIAIVMMVFGFIINLCIGFLGNS